MLKSLITNAFESLVRALKKLFRPKPQPIPIPVKAAKGKFRFHGWIIVALILPVMGFSQIPAGVYPNTVDAKGKKQGAWKKVDEQGSVVYVGQFKDDKPYGLFTYFDTEERKMTEMNFVKDGVAYAKMYYIDGKVQAEGKYVNQKKDSVWRFYNVDGLFLSEESWAMGKREGKSIVYHPGTTQPASVTIYKNGVEEGPYVEYYLDGQKKMEATYIAGNMEGTATWYFSDGRINIIGAYQHAVKHGKWTYYNADGSVKGTETWSLGKLTSQEQVIKPEDLNKTIEDPQDPKHDQGGGGGGN
jgi:antitoxin component YwqK of YwqJK toxin-antitoxin module